MSRKKISQEEFIEILLLRRKNIGDNFLKIFLNKKNINLDIKNLGFGYTGNKKRLNFETIILSLWIITLSMPSDKLRDLLHESFCKQTDLTGKQKQEFFKEIDKRYKNYFAAFNTWQKNHQNGSALGSVIFETIINQNPNFPFDKKIALVGDVESLIMFTIVINAFKATMEMIKEIKGKYIIENF